LRKKCWLKINVMILGILRNQKGVAVPVLSATVTPVLMKTPDRDNDLIDAFHRPCGVVAANIVLAHGSKLPARTDLNQNPKGISTGG
jgi:hypothetical protein